MSAFWGPGANGLFGGFQRSAPIAGYASWPSLIGAEMIQGGGCGDPNDWTLGLGWAVALNKMTATTTNTGTVNDGTPPGAFIDGATYRCVYTVDAITLGSITININDALGTARNSAGTYSEDLVSSGSSDGWYVQGQGGNCTCQLDNFSVKSVGLLGVSGDWTLDTVDFDAATGTLRFLDETVASAALTGSAATAFDAAVSNNTACATTLTSDMTTPLAGDLEVSFKGGSPVTFTFTGVGGEQVTHTITSGSGSGCLLEAGATAPANNLARIQITPA